MTLLVQMSPIEQLQHPSTFGAPGGVLPVNPAPSYLRTMGEFYCRNTSQLTKPEKGLHRMLNGPKMKINHAIAFDFYSV